ncbi:sugar transferase [Candidatus Saccharibacteria bacterium]|jgi:N-acetyllactosaminide 3-alpha-galactosyltransferase|nr:sugar transferase [Candidatus Saccharibacteria bacterium]
MYREYGKRIEDVSIALAALVILGLPMLLVAAAIRLTSKGPALFRQKRFGKDKQLFTVYKFRTMSTKAPKNMPTNSFTNADSYITPLGGVLRKLSIDELPQLLNVIKGDMSIVGPRPVIKTEKKLISLRQKYRANSVKPGITGWAQVNGRDDLDDQRKAEMDGEYVQRLSFLTDVKIMIKTIGAVLMMSGHTEGSERTVTGVDNALE